jgi:peptidoglycan hydrolase CwlO-like protein
MGETLITLLISSITGIVSFFVGQQRAKKEIDSLSLQNMEKSLMIYQSIIDDLQGRMNELLTKVQLLEDKIDELKTENLTLKEMLSKHSEESANRRKSIKKQVN